MSRAHSYSHRRHHSPTFPSLHLRHNSFSNPSVAIPTSQLIIKPFRCFINVIVHYQTLLSHLLRHKLCSFSKLSVTSPKSQLILQSFRRFTYITAYSPTLPLLHLRHSSFSNPSFASPTSQTLHLIHLASRPWPLLEKDVQKLHDIPQCLALRFDGKTFVFSHSCLNVAKQFILVTKVKPAKDNKIIGWSGPQKRHWWAVVWAARVRFSVTPCGLRGGRNVVWVGFSRGFSRFPLPQISFHHFSTLISSIFVPFHQPFWLCVRRGRPSPLLLTDL